SLVWAEAVTVLRLTDTETVVGASISGSDWCIVGIGMSIQISKVGSDSSCKPACSETVDQASLTPRLKVQAVETYESLQLVEDGNSNYVFNSNIRHVLVDVHLVLEGDGCAL